MTFHLPSRATNLIRRNPERAEAVAGLLAGSLVVVVSLLQWGVTDLGWARGVSLGVATGLALPWYYRRRRQREERRERALLEQRLQLARELHDAVAGQVAVVGIQAAAARRVLASSPAEAAAALERIEHASRSAVADLRRMLLTLREGEASPAPTGGTGALNSKPGSGPTASEPGLLELAGLLEEVGRAGLAVELDVTGMRPDDLPVSIDHAAYRIVQEAVTNVLKHAPDAPTRVAVDYRHDAIGLSVTNDPGSPPRSDHPGAGLGLVGVRERAGLFGGSVVAGRTNDGGWSVVVNLPLANLVPVARR